MDFLLAQLHTFLVMVGLGFCLGLLFSIYQSFLKRIRIKKKWLSIMDILFGIITGLAGFCVLLYTNYGELRFFVIISLAIGLLIYFHTTNVVLKDG